MQVKKKSSNSVPRTLSEETVLLHLDRLDSALPYGALFEQEFVSVAYEFGSTKEIEASYQGQDSGRAYARQGNPTSESLERKITAIEGGIGTICFTSGMAAYDAVFATLFKSGDHVIASNFLFSNTQSLLNTYSSRFGVCVEYVDVTDSDTVLKALKTNTVAVFVESIGNPKTQIPDFVKIGTELHKLGVAFVVDNTLTTPCAFKPKSVMASLSINSLTKSIGGHGRSLGGSVTDTGQTNWLAARPFIEPRFQTAGDLAYLMQLGKYGLRDKGATLSSADAATIAMGLETLPLRIKVASNNAVQLGNFLENRPEVAAVYYPGLQSHPQHMRAKTHFSHAGPLMSFELAPHVSTTSFLDRLSLIVRSSSLGDNRTLVIPPASTIFYDVGADVRAAMGISDGLVRMSVGIEALEDLMADITQAFEQTG